MPALGPAAAAAACSDPELRPARGALSPIRRFSGGVWPNIFRLFAPCTTKRIYSGLFVTYTPANIFELIRTVYGHIYFVYSHSISPSKYIQPIRTVYGQIYCAYTQRVQPSEYIRSYSLRVRPGEYIARTRAEYGV